VNTGTLPTNEIERLSILAYFNKGYHLWLERSMQILADKLIIKA